MTVADLRRLYAYHRWANGLILEAAGKLTAEEFDRDLRSSFPSVRATLVHLLGAEWIWLQRWHGSSPTSLLDGGSLTTFAALRARWGANEAEQAAFVAALDEAGLARVCAYRNLKGEAHESRIGDQLQHIINHATYHRGQIVTMLRQMGHAPPGTDLVLFFKQPGWQA